MVLVQQLLHFLLLGFAGGQLQVLVRKYEGSWREDGNYPVLAEYSFEFPSGFSVDWFTTAHANIPSEGITGFLYQPYPEDGCSSFNTSTCQYINMSRIAILDDYHLCTEEKIRSIEESSFDAVVTYSPGDRDRDVGGHVHDRSTGKAVDVVTSEVPLVVVSETFYTLLLQVAITRNCSMTDTLLTLSVGTVNVESIQLSLTVFFLFCGSLLVFTPILCCWVMFMCCRCFRKRRGSYDVQENYQINELGGRRRQRERFHGTAVTPYTPEQREFSHEEAETMFTQCTICLENFIDSEVISVLACDEKHIFHPHCINEWLKSWSTCPVCRTVLHSM